MRKNRQERTRRDCNFDSQNTIKKQFKFMKKSLSLAAIILGLATTAVSAQTSNGVGVNTATPRVTLDVVGSPSTASAPDGIMIPSLTATQLTAKNSVYTTTHKGTLVFVTDGSGTAGTKTANVDGMGYYYYDDTAESNAGRWVKVGGGSSAPVSNRMTIRAQTGSTINNSDLNNAILVTSNVTFDVNTLTEAVNGDVIHFVDANTSGTGFNVGGTKLHVSATTTPMAMGGTLSYIFDGTNWYSFNGY